MVSAPNGGVRFGSNAFHGSNPMAFVSKLNAQDLSFAWVTQAVIRNDAEAGTSFAMAGLTLLSDTASHLYVTGTFVLDIPSRGTVNATVTFGSIVETITQAAGYVSKINVQSGAVMLLKLIKSNTLVQPSGIASDNATGMLSVVGRFITDVTVEGIQISGSADGNTVFIASFNGGLNLETLNTLHSRTVVGLEVFPNDVAIDQISGDIFVASTTSDNSLAVSLFNSTDGDEIESVLSTSNDNQAVILAPVVAIFQQTGFVMGTYISKFTFGGKTFPDVTAQHVFIARANLSNSIAAC